jgi:hypothetical protein
VGNDTSTILRVLGWLSVCAFMAGVPLGGAWVIEAGKDRARERAERLERRVAARLDWYAQQLEINASQQSAWLEYENAHKAIARDLAGKDPPVNQDPAAIEQGGTEAGVDSARQLATLSLATQRLQDVLSPDQRSALDGLGPPGRHPHGHAWRVLAKSMVFVFTPS